MNKVLMEFLSKTLNLDEAGVTSLFNEDGSPKEDSLLKFLELDKARVAKLQQGKLDEGYKKAQKEVMSNLEKTLKTKFSIESDKTGVELVESIIEQKTPAGDALSEEQVKKHKAYLDLNESVTKKVAEAVKAKETEFNDYKSKVERGQALSVVKSKAQTLFESLNPILSSDPGKAAKQKELFLREFEQENYRIENDRIILLNADGSDKTDAHGHRVDFEKEVKAKAEAMYDFKAVDPKGSPGGAAGGAGGQKKTYQFKDEADFTQQYTQATDIKEKIAIAQSYEEQRKA